MIYDCIVIGKGLIGSAAAKYLSQSQKKVAVLGPDETQAINDGIVFSSHYDESRIQRVIGKDATWTLLNQQSADGYANLEKESEITFHSKVGCLYVNPYGNDAYLENAPALAKITTQKFQHFKSSDALYSSFPGFHFPKQAKGMFESSPSGHINPRLLIKAQLKIFKKNGGEILNDVVNDISYSNGNFKIATLAGKKYQSKKILLAPGAFANFLNLLKRKLLVNIKGETTILVKVNAEEAHRLAKLPSLLYEIAEPEIQNIYLVRPLQYPDGEFYIKMGANLPGDLYFNNLEDIQEWFKIGNSNKNLETMKNALMAIMPELAIEDCLTKRCIVTFTRHGHPYIGSTDQKDLFIAAGGNGYAAMCSDAIGKIAATLIQEGFFPKGFSSKDFHPVFID
ncbi:MAG TPA: FAD-dependent oxidoreductase [Hanamia sp.]